MRGAIREDDYISGPNPWIVDPDLPIPFVRVFNHFFDPVNRRGLTVGVTLGDMAPQWAIGSVDVFNQPNTPNPNRKNHYTVFDAREAMYRALTGQDKNGNPVAATEADRKKYWATTFRSLGDVVHLLQDMAQPQHTRNDSHCGDYFNATLSPCGHKSVYESYIDARAKGDDFVVYQTPFVGVQTDQASAFGVTVLQSPTRINPLTYGGYPTPSTFSDFLSFYTTTGTDPINTARGLADYSNRGFFSAGTNLGNTTYQLPTQNPNAYTQTQLTVGWLGLPLTQNAPVTLLNGVVPDKLNPAAQGGSQPLTSYGIWDQFLLQANSSPAYSLNRYNYDAMAGQLIPRAVAYSAGLINYFFRGKMEISLPAEGVYGVADHSSGNGFNKIKLKLKNTTPNNELMAGGKLVAVARYHVNTCYQADLLGEWASPGKTPAACRAPDETILTSNTVSAVTLDATQQPFQFTFSPAIPFGISDLSIQVVYRGPLGNETDAVVVATKNISEPTYFALYNVTDYVFCVNGTYYRNDANGSISAAAQAAIIAAGGNLNGNNGPSPYGATQMAFYQVPTPISRPLQPPLAEVDNLQPGRLIRLALLSDTGDLPYGLDIPGYTFITSTHFPSARNELVVSGNASNYYSFGTQSFRGNNSHFFTYGYRYWGGGQDCQNTPESTIDTTTPAIPPAVLVPLSSISF